MMNSFIGWIGGKRQLRKEILSRFPDDMGRYIEVFGGAGWVLFGKEVSSGQIEVFNDCNGELINLYRCVKYHCAALQDELEWLPDSRELFFDYVEQNTTRGLTDIQRAARFLYCLKLSFGSSGRTFATTPKSVENVKTYLSKVQERLKNVIIEHRDFEPLIRTYDRKDALFYLDPPYVGTEKYYDVSFPEQDHQRLAEVLKQIQGRFILSYNDDPLVRELYSSWCQVEEITRRNTLSGTGQNKQLFAELIIRNYS